LFIFIHTHPIQYFAPLYQYLTAQGLPLEVWYCDDSSIRGKHDAEFGESIVWDIPLLQGYAYRFFDNETTVKNPQRGYSSYRNPALLQALKTMKPATVVVHGWSYATYVQVLLKARHWGHRLAFRGETNWQMEMNRPPWQRPFRRLLLQYLLKEVAWLMPIGHQSKKFYEWLGRAKSVTDIIPYAVHNQRFQQAALSLNRDALRAALGIAPQTVVFLFSGKYIAKKRPLDLLHAVARLSAENMYIIMMGAGALQPAMEAFIDQHQMQHKVLLTGFVNQQRVPEYYAMADALVMCSDYGETWGLSVNEAMNFSLPVVVSDRTGCAADLVTPNENGFVFETGNIDALAHCMRQLCQMSPAQRTAMGAASLKRINQYSFATILNALQNLA
jgi:glycosyltransferase involved in cell wall biosynthesis